MAWFRGMLMLVLALLAVTLLLMGLMAVSTTMPCKSLEPFAPVVPDTRIPQAAPSGNAVELNGCWRSILTYLQANPGKAMPFLNVLKANFFNSSCSLRQPRIQFESLADQYQPIFT